MFAVRHSLCVFALLIATGCQGVHTLLPLPATKDDRALGEWYVEGEPTSMAVVRNEGDEYVAEPMSTDKGEQPLRFRLLKAGPVFFVQSGGKSCEEFPGENQCFALGRLEFGPEENTARLFNFDTAAMFKASLAENFGVPFELHRKVHAPPPALSRNDFLLTGDEAQVQAFLLKFGSRFTATEPIRYRRVKK